MRTAALLGAAMVCGHAAAAQYDCVDERGVRHRMPTRVDTELIKFQCQEVPVETSATARVSLPGRRYSSVMLVEPANEKAAEPVHWPRVPDLRHALPRAASVSRAALTGPIDALIHATALEFGHDPDLLRAIIKVESGFNAKAVSPKGAVGLMQLMPATARRFGVSDSSTLTTPGVNLEAGARYLAYLKQLFPRNLELAIAAYNAGEGAVIKRNYRIPPFPETQSYVQQVFAAYRAFRAQRENNNGTRLAQSAVESR